MKKIVILILAFLVYSNLFNQQFEGNIIYANSYLSKNPQMTDMQWSDMMGSIQEYSIKGANYKSISNGKLLQWQLYVSSENKLYTKMSNTESILWNDGSIQGDEVLNAEVTPYKVDVLGYPCKEIILTCKSGIQKYYFNPKFAVNAELFINHKFGNWYEFLSRANALPLKMIIETSQFTMISVAQEIVSVELSNDVFLLPADQKVEKSPY